MHFAVEDGVAVVIGAVVEVHGAVVDDLAVVVVVMVDGGRWRVSALYGYEGVLPACLRLRLQLGLWCFGLRGPHPPARYGCELLGIGKVLS